jgi:hypothetical protein
MGCPDSLHALQGSEATLREILNTLQRIEVSQRKYKSIAMFYDGSCSSITTTRKRLFADDNSLPTGTRFSRVTVKVRSMGTNSYIRLGTAATPGMRLTAVSQAYTFIAPDINGNTAPLILEGLIVLGDGANGVLEISGIRIDSREQP